MAIEYNLLKQLLEDAFPGDLVELIDLAGDNDHYQATIISEKFRDKNRVQQHQMVYSALQGKMQSELHALALSTKIPSIK